MPHMHPTTSRPLMILVLKQMGGGVRGGDRGDNTHTHTEGMFMNGRNEVFLPAGCSGCHMADWDITYRGGWTLQVGQTADTNTTKHWIKPKSSSRSSPLDASWIHSQKKKLHLAHFLINRPSFHLSVSLSQPLKPGVLYAIITAVPENNLTWLCVSMATMPTSVAVSQFLSTYIITSEDYSTKTAEMSGEKGLQPHGASICDHTG